MHRGHQAVIEALAERGAQFKLPATVITFEPQPLEFLRPAQAPARLTRLREKLLAIQRCAVDRVLLLKFDSRLAALSSTDFIEDILVGGLGIRHLYVGDDFRFGRDRSGDFAQLRRAGREHGFAVESLTTVSDGGERVSSTRVRRALEAKDLVEVERCLGRPFTLVGRVAHGDKRGRTIGFPTLNIPLHRRVSPLRGVYAVRVGGLAGQSLPGVANVGHRPTVGGDVLPRLEVHLFDFDRAVYGAQVVVEFVAPIRDERRFDSFEQLREQIGRDAAAARRLLDAADVATRAG
jgi:riboflavin kinase/FMN adenylyltransferase